jgi:hypothetical protein
MVTKQYLKVATFSTLFLMGAESALAAPPPARLFTSPLVFNQDDIDGFEAMDCNVVNVSRAPRTGTISIIRLDGQLLNSVPYNVGPGKGTGTSVTTLPATLPPPVAPLTVAYCKVTVRRGGKGDIRASLIVRDAGGNTTAVSQAQ